MNGLSGNRYRMHFIDFHSHLDWYEQDSSFNTQIQNYRGIIVSASVDRESYFKNLETARRAEKLNPEITIVPTAGVHPENAERELERLEEYRELCAESPLTGEIGLDFYWYRNVSPLAQEKVFRFFLECCDEMHKYCVIHTKGAEEKIAAILEEYPHAKPVIHWYDGPQEIFDEFVRRRYYQTFGCETVRSERIKNFLEKIPSELVLAETDNPSAEPWLGGTENGLNLIERIYSDIAEVKGLSLEKTAEIINENARKILGECGIKSAANQ